MGAGMADCLGQLREIAAGNVLGRSSTQCVCVGVHASGWFLQADGWWRGQDREAQCKRHGVVTGRQPPIAADRHLSGLRPWHSRRSRGSRRYQRSTDSSASFVFESWRSRSVPCWRYSRRTARGGNPGTGPLRPGFSHLLIAGGCAGDGAPLGNCIDDESNGTGTSLPSRRAASNCEAECGEARRVVQEALRGTTTLAVNAVASAGRSAAFSLTCLQLS